MTQSLGKTMKQSSIWLIIIQAIVVMLLLFNLFVKPFPRGLTVLDIKTDLNQDAVIVGILVNSISFIMFVFGWIFLIRSKAEMNYFFLCLGLVNIITLSFWLSYLQSFVQGIVALIGEDPDMYEIKKMSRRSKNSVGAKIGIAIILLFCVGIFIRSIIRIKNLRNNFTIINGGEINSIESPSKTGPFFRYSFYYNDKVFEGSCKTSDFKFIPREYRMHKYPIAIENDNPGNNEMLFSPQNFKTFKSDFPDSLNWLLPYVK